MSSKPDVVELELSATGRARRPYRAADPWDGFSLEPIRRYLESLRRLPRLAVEARYRQDLGEEPPFHARRDWMIEALGRNFQREHYRRNGRALPDLIREADSRFILRGPRLLSIGQTDRDEPDPAEASFRGAHVSARMENPYDRGLPKQAFSMILLAGPDGIEYDELKARLMREERVSAIRAEIFARKVFTQWVKSRWVRIRFQEGGRA